MGRVDDTSRSSVRRVELGLPPQSFRPPRRTSSRLPKGSAKEGFRPA